MVNAAPAAPGAECGLSEPITSLPLPTAWGSTNLRQVSPWLPWIQQWMGVEEQGGMQLESAVPGGPAWKPLLPSTPIPSATLDHAHRPLAQDMLAAVPSRDGCRGQQGGEQTLFCSQ